MTITLTGKPKVFMRAEATFVRKNISRGKTHCKKNIYSSNRCMAPSIAEVNTAGAFEPSPAGQPDRLERQDR